MSKSRFALAQVHHPGTVFLLAVYESYVESLDEFAKPDNRPSIVAWTNDAELFKKRWIGPIKSRILHKISMPEYKVFVDGTAMIERFDGTIYRKFNERRDAMVTFRKSRSPKIVEACISAMYNSSTVPPHCYDMLT